MHPEKLERLTAWLAELQDRSGEVRETFDHIRPIFPEYYGAPHVARSLSRFGPSRVGLNVRRLAALDMALHGARFTVLEFAAGAVLCMLLGAFSLAVGLRLLAHGFAWQLVFGALLLTVGLNYIPLLLHALDLARRGRASEEAAAKLTDGQEVRSYTVRQLWLLVPFVIVVLAVVQRGRGQP